MKNGNHQQVSFADTNQEKISVVERAEGNINLEIHKGGNVQFLKTNWFNFYIQSWRTVIEAFFGEDTGERVPAVMLLAGEELKVGDYEINSPSDEAWKVGAIFGRGRPGAVEGDGWGKGTLRVSEISSTPSAQLIKGSFEFIYTDVEGVVVKVVAKEFWAASNE